MGAPPHRGVATLTYILQGEVEHFDSAGNTGEIHLSGAQWMKAGNGKSDLLFISLSENNGTYTTAFKNIHDWISVIYDHIELWGDKPKF